jgi:broad specificity phosphatase PhoE
MTANALPQIWLVRHAETEWSLTGRHTGRTDIPLTSRGEQLAAALKPRLVGRHFAKVLTSPLIRARRTCELAGFGDVAANDANLLEWDYGEYEGRRTAEIRVERPGWNPFRDGCPGGETLAQFEARANSLVDELRSLNADALLFAHRDILRMITARWIGLPAVEAQRFYLDPASISVLGYDHDASEPIIRKLNA